jgi:hypothetical protein
LEQRSIVDYVEDEMLEKEGPGNGGEVSADVEGRNGCVSGEEAEKREKKRKTENGKPRGGDLHALSLARVRRRWPFFFLFPLWEWEWE